MLAGANVQKPELLWWLLSCAARHACGGVTFSLMQQEDGEDDVEVCLHMNPVAAVFYSRDWTESPGFAPESVYANSSTHASLLAITDMNITQETPAEATQRMKRQGIKQQIVVHRDRQYPNRRLHSTVSQYLFKHMLDLVGGASTMFRRVAFNDVAKNVCRCAHETPDHPSCKMYMSTEQETRYWCWVDDSTVEACKDEGHRLFES